jgi:signal peptidase I
MTESTPAQPRSTKPRQRRWLLWSLLALLVLLLVVKFGFVDQYTIPQNGMYPSLPQGCRFLVLKRAYRNPSEVRRGDVIIFVKTVHDEPYKFIWRVVGLPGDRVEVAGENVSANGKMLPHEKLRTDANATIYRETNGDASYEVAYQPGPSPIPSAALTVPSDEFFVLGDNRDAASDSRMEGTVPFASIIGRKLPR